ncbi:SDR family oxidoreductase [Alteromonas oceanisediminis]|uniref:SDR family oxidoreductase n=1 Tax=Alteromonas oceanisediminis TaxID=2836180 RepID=UPI001BDA3316|nr:SDR family oxidoreductase [Alteromonas oceanisediminis]MBT0586497.1 SDR family oxidoreductase [Alteromonas oceanisediminis]
MNIVITGANRGIGLAMVKRYRAAGESVYALCRHTSEELKATGADVIEGVDVGNAEHLPSALAALKKVSIDVLINNAGVLANESLNEWSPSTIEQQFRVNALGPLLVTQALKEQFVKGAKVAMITSRMGSMEDNGSGGYYGYRMSKAALNAAGVSLARDMAEQGVAVALLHPGYVQTEMVGYGGDIDADTAAERLLARIDALTLDNSGSFWHSNGEKLPW